MEDPAQHGMDPIPEDAAQQGTDWSLRDAAQKGSIDALYLVIRKDAYVLERIDWIPFVETPLHIAASAGHTQFVMEIMRLKPSFARKLNQDGFTPMQLALQNNQTQVMRLLLDFDKDLVRVQGRAGVTPLHYLAQIGDLHLLTEFLRVCPKSIEDVTIQRETVLHIALKNNMFDAFRLLLGWLRRAWFKNASSYEKKLLNSQDEEGNTVLHIAVSKNQLQIVRLLLDFRSFFHRRIDVKAKNSRGFTAFDMLQGHARDKDNQQIKYMLRRARCFSGLHLPRIESLADYFKSPVKIDERIYIFFLRQRMQITNDTRNVLLVVAALLVTVTFQATISPPGGVWQETKLSRGDRTEDSSGVYWELPHVAGTAIMDEITFDILASLNLISFSVTVFIIFLLLPSGFRNGLFSVPLYILAVYFVVSIIITAPIGTSNTGNGSFENIVVDPVFLWFMFVPPVLLLLELIVRLRKRKLVQAFLPKAKVLDATLT